MRPVYMNGHQVPQSRVVKYLGLKLDSRLTWSDHIQSKRLVLNKRFKILYRLLCPSSRLSLRLKLLLYKSLLRPIWSYGLQLFGSAKKSNLSILQSFQSKCLRLITGAPYYVNNKTLHSDLKMPYVRDYAKQLFKTYYSKLQHHPNTTVSVLHRRLFPTVRRFRRSWSRDLLL